MNRQYASTINFQSHTPNLIRMSNHNLSLLLQLSGIPLRLRRIEVNLMRLTRIRLTGLARNPTQGEETYHLKNRNQILRLSLCQSPQILKPIVP